MAEVWQRGGKPFAGLLFAHQTNAGIGQLVRDLELIAKASESFEWHNKVEYLPYSKPSR